jgi:uncharacterized membrane protein
MDEPLSPGFKRGWVISMAVSMGLVALALLPPFLSEGPRAFVMELFSSVCHQLPNRTAHIDGVSLGVCHRCFGTYLGLPAAGIVFGILRGRWPFTARTAPVFLALATIPAVIDWGGEIVGFWQNTPVSRSITGAIMGSVAGYFLVAAIVDGFIEHVANKRKRAI